MKLYVAALVLSLLACSNESSLKNVVEAFGSSTEAPVFLASRAVSPTVLDFEFSQPVKVKNLNFQPALEIEQVTEGTVVEIQYTERPGKGERIVADVLVEDEQQNTLNVLVPLRTRNDKLPQVQITEIRTEYSKPKVEFIEFKVLGDGNLGALQLFIASNGLDVPIYEFQPVDVKRGDYVVLHLRKLDENAKDETGTALGVVVKETDATEGRDFWLPDAKKVIRKTDAVYFVDQDGKIMDAVLMSADSGTQWANENIAKAAELFNRQGAWKGTGTRTPTPNDAVQTANTTATRSISRNESKTDSNTASDWFITGSSKATPGIVNVSIADKYVPK
ncbi:hypothetical protein FACS1894172_21480 [Spirochaetia bacterium]|nr:hypothetical protein FACS1894172_21480 [Spirochaetia bacterium]